MKLCKFAKREGGTGGEGIFLVYSRNKNRKTREKKNLKRNRHPCAHYKVEMGKEKSAVRSQRTLTLKPTVGTVFNVLPATRRKNRVVFPAASRPTRSTRRSFLDLYRAHPCPIFVGAVVVIDGRCEAWWCSI